MSEPIYYATIRYRQKKKASAFTNLLHKGSKAMIQLSATSITVEDVTSSRLVSSLLLTDITACYEKSGNVYIETDNSSDIFDFCSPYHSGLMPSISSRKRAQEFLDVIKKLGVKVS